MSNHDQPETPQQAIADIPMEYRPIVVRWLKAQSRKADHTADELRAVNRTIKDDTTAKRVKYWEHFASACRDLASKMEQAKLVPKRGRGKDSHVSSKS